MGGRGSGSDGPSLGRGGPESVNIQGTTDVWSYRHNANNEPFVDAINTSVGRIQQDFPGVMDSVQTVDAVKFGGSDDLGTLGVYGGGMLGINQRYTDVNKMNSVYDASVASGFHPSRGDRTGTEAVALHEMGHAVSDHVAKKMGAADLHEASERIVNDAYKNSGGKGGTKAWAGKISGYAQHDAAECVAEAVADWYCNGDKASAQSKAIMRELKKYS